MKLFGKIADIFFPPRCVFCGGYTSTANKVCTKCVKDIPFITEKPCKGCGAEKSRCSCTAIVNHYDRVIAPFYYEDAAKKMVLQIKNQGMISSAKVGASFMAECLKRNFPQKHFDIVTQVPTSYITAVKRGHDHTKILAKLVAKKSGIQYKNILDSKSKFRKQKSLDRLGRLANIFGKYRMRKVDINNKNIILVDDVKTTGATANECARILKNNGAKSVTCLTLAITARKKSE